MLASNRGDRLQVERLTKLWRLAERDLDLHAPFIEANSPGWKGIHVANEPILDSPAPWSSISNDPWTPESSSTSVMSWTTAPEISPRPTSLTALSQASFSPTSLASNIPKSLVARCPACSMTFAGSPQDMRLNLQCHLWVARGHNKTTFLECPQPECLTKPPMRSDNLDPHLQRRHRMPWAERQVVIDECIMSARRANVDGSLQRALRQAVNV